MRKVTKDALSHFFDASWWRKVKLVADLSAADRFEEIGAGLLTPDLILEQLEVVFNMLN